jgi:hypothetical protein
MPDQDEQTRAHDEPAQEPVKNQSQLATLKDDVVGFMSGAMNYE